MIGSRTLLHCQYASVYLGGNLSLSRRRARSATHSSSAWAGCGDNGGAHMCEALGETGKGGGIGSNGGDGKHWDSYPYHSQAQLRQLMLHRAAQEEARDRARLAPLVGDEPAELLSAS